MMFMGKYNKKFFAILLWWLMVVCLINPSAIKCESVPSLPEYEAKALFLFNFLKFVDWKPESFTQTDGKLIIGVLGVDPFGKAFQEIEGKKIDEREIVIKRFSSEKEIEYVHMLFISVSEKENIAGIMKRASTMNTLTVSDIEGFAKKGGMIGFVNISRESPASSGQSPKVYIGFEINLKEAEKAGVKLRAQLLRLARRVIDHENE